MAVVINTMTLWDIDGQVCKARCAESGSLQVELRSAREAIRFAKLLRDWADWVEEGVHNPDNIATWERKE